METKADTGETVVKLEARNSVECITHAGHSIALLHFVTV